MRLLLLVGLLSAFGALAAADAADVAAVATKIATTCQSCHGPGGNSPSASVPRLNGQQAAYIVSRLHDFLDPTKEDPHATKTMWGVVSGIDSATFPEIASYYARQAPTPRGNGGANGKQLFLHGAAGIPACASCHGAEGQGSGAIPRLAGQHHDYLLAQLQRLQLGLRFSDTMHPALKAMSDVQAAAIAAYLAKD